MPQFTPFALNLQGRLVSYSKPALMAIVNVTPDSFFEGSRSFEADAIAGRVEEIISQGADMIDVGGFSTRPGHSPVSPEEEWRRVKLGIDIVRSISSSIPISVDTFRGEIALKALNSGADIINDVTAMGADAEMRRVVVASGAPYVLTHPAESRVTPEMKGDELAAVVIEDLSREIERLTLDGVADVIVDPGFGFGKTTQQNFDLMARLESFALLQRPVLVGISRKSMIWRTIGATPDESLNGTTVLNTFSVIKGASIIRVHDVKAAREVIDLCSLLSDSSLHTI